MPRMFLTTCLACVAALVPPTQPRQRLTVAHNVASAKPNARNTKYVDQLLDVAVGTDRGVRAKEGTRNIIDGLIARLERSYKGADASETPEWLYRDSEVVYVGQRSSKRANAAGGRFRGRVGGAVWNQISGAPRHGRDVVPMTASARWRGDSKPSTRLSVRWRGGSRRSQFSG